MDSFVSFIMLYLYLIQCNIWQTGCHIIACPPFYYYQDTIKLQQMKNAFKVLNEADKTIILNPDKPFFSLIWLHGLGDSSAGFLDYFTLPQSPLHKGGRIKLLHAPIKPVTINGGMKCPSWYDIKALSFDPKQKVSEDDRCSLSEVKQSLAIVDKKVQQQYQFWKQQKVEGDIYKRIFVGGFSQGCAISLLYGLTSKNIIGGVIGFSGYLFSSFEIPNLDKLPILLHHGLYDPMINYKHAFKSYERIGGSKKVEIKEKQLEHTVSEAQVQEMTLWIVKKLKENAIL